MKNRMSVSRCCCSCTDCCNGSFADEFDVEFTFTNDGCTTCADLDGVYTLAKQGGVCNWIYNSGAISQACNPPYGLTLTRKQISLSIYCYTPTQYKIDVHYQIWAAYPCPIGTGLEEYQFYQWRSFVDVADFSCSTADAVPIDYLTRMRSIAAWRCPLGFPGAFLDIPFNWLCDTSADVLITAVP